MRETLNVRWKPGTLDVLLVTSPHATLEWHPQIFKMIFGRPALDALYLTGFVQVTREAAQEPPSPACSSAA